MLISHIIRKPLETVKPFTSIDSVESVLLKDGFLVVMDDTRYHGLLTISDIIKRPHNLVIDCLCSKPEVWDNNDVFQALEIMVKENYYVLPVFSSSSSEYLGIVKYSDVLREVHNLKSPPTEIKIENFTGNVDFESIKHTFIHELYHNTKNPLQIIYSSLEMMKDKKEIHGLEFLIDNILINTNKIDDIINKLYNEYFYSP